MEGRRKRMGREVEEEEEPKAKLVKEICFVSMAFASCEHLRPNADVLTTAFIDWYLVLKVGEDSGSEVIRHRYRELALQLHPDKNKHPKAETAFKLISEAYSCLSNKSRRKAFNGERATNFCKLCYQSWQSDEHKSARNFRISSSKGSEKSTGENNSSKKPKPVRQQSAANRTKRNHIVHKLKQLQSRFQEECRVIESYLKATVNTTGRESPLFDPYNLTMFPNYPYQRPAMAAAANAARGQAYCDSPVYQIRSDCWARRPPKPQIF